MYYCTDVLMSDVPMYYCTDVLMMDVTICCLLFINLGLGNIGLGRSDYLACRIC